MLLAIVDTGKRDTILLSIVDWGLTGDEIVFVIYCIAWISFWRYKPSWYWWSDRRRWQRRWGMYVTLLRCYHHVWFSLLFCFDAFGLLLNSWSIRLYRHGYDRGKLFLRHICITTMMTRDPDPMMEGQVSYIITSTSQLVTTISTLIINHQPSLLIIFCHYILYRHNVTMLPGFTASHGRGNPAVYSTPILEID